MKEDIAKAISQQTAAALDGAKGWSRSGAFVGLDVHRDTVAVAIATPGRDEPVYRGEIAHEPKALKKWLDGLNDEFGGAVLLFSTKRVHAVMACTASCWRLAMTARLLGRPH